MNGSLNTWKTTALAWAIAGLAATADGQEAAVPEPTVSPLLWRIDGTRPSFLYGTVHVSDRRVLALPKAVLAAIESSRTVYTEAPVDKETRRSHVRDLMLPDGETLRSVLPEDLRDRLERYVQSRGLSLQRFDQLKPWAVTDLVRRLVPNDPTTNGKALDGFIVELAIAHGKRLDSLETMREQTGIFDRLTRDEQLDWLRSTLDRLEADQAEGANPSETLIQLYLAGDPEAIYHHVIASLPRSGDLGEKLTARLLQERNLLMSKRISDKLRTDPARGHFFAIGAGHLAGEQGLLALLREDGFRLQRVGVEPVLQTPPTPREAELEALVETLRAEIRHLEQRIRELEK